MTPPRDWLRRPRGIACGELPPGACRARLNDEGHVGEYVAPRATECTHCADDVRKGEVVLLVLDGNGFVWASHVDCHVSFLAAALFRRRRARR